MLKIKVAGYTILLKVDFIARGGRSARRSEGSGYYFGSTLMQTQNEAATFGASSYLVASGEIGSVSSCRNVRVNVPPVVPDVARHL